MVYFKVCWKRPMQEGSKGNPGKYRERSCKNAIDTDKTLPHQHSEPKVSREKVFQAGEKEKRQHCAFYERWTLVLSTQEDKWKRMCIHRKPGKIEARMDPNRHLCSFPTDRDILWWCKSQRVRMVSRLETHKPNIRDQIYRKHNLLDLIGKKIDNSAVNVSPQISVDHWKKPTKI